MEKLSDRLLTSLKIRNMTQSELSRKTGIDKSYINKYCQGKYKPKQDGIYLLAKALNVRIEWLMGFDVPMEPDDEAMKPNVVITEMDEFTYALYNESKELSDDDKLLVLDMVRSIKLRKKKNTD